MRRMSLYAVGAADAGPRIQSGGGVMSVLRIVLSVVVLWTPSPAVAGQIVSTEPVVETPMTPISNVSVAMSSVSVGVSRKVVQLR